MKITDGAKIFIKNETSDKFLFVLRDNKPTIPYPNMWDLVGGGIEQGELPIKTIKREIQEEINIEVCNVKELYPQKTKVTFNEFSREITMFIFIGNIVNTDISNIAITKNEGQKLAFFSLYEIAQMNNVVPFLKETLKDNYAKIQDFKFYIR